MGKITKKCPICQEFFESWPCANRKFCSRKCSSQHSSWHLKEKYERGELFGEEHRKKISAALKSSEKAKRTQFKKGEKNPAYGRNQTGSANNNWKGGITPSNQKKRNSSEYKEWRKSIFERDNYTCQHCGGRGYLHAHHLKHFSKCIEEERWQIENGITLCVACHEAIHGRFIGKFKQKH